MRLTKLRLKNNANDDFSILIHDDEQGIIDALMVVLKNHSMRNVCGTTDSEELLKLLSNKHYDVLILDYMLNGKPYGTAKELLPKIREVAGATKIILLTGYQDLCPPINSIINLGIDGYWEKSDNFLPMILQLLSLKNTIKRFESFEGSFGQKLAYKRKKKAISQEEFAEKIGVSREMVCKYENDKASPSTEVLSHIANVLDIDLNWLIKSQELCEMSIN